MIVSKEKFRLHIFLSPPTIMNMWWRHITLVLSIIVIIFNIKEIQ